MNITRKHEETEKLSRPLPHSSPILGLHCSGANASQWACLKAYFSKSTEVLLPDFIGTSARGHLTGKSTFSLADEALSILPQIASIGRPVHIVGHSYGGAIALHIAKVRPDLVKSVCIYEPTLFSILDTSNADDQKLFPKSSSLPAQYVKRLPKGLQRIARKCLRIFGAGSERGRHCRDPDEKRWSTGFLKRLWILTPCSTKRNPNGLLYPKFPQQFWLESKHMHIQNGSPSFFQIKGRCE